MAGVFRPALWVAAGLLLAPAVHAFDWKVSGFIREEIAYQIPGDGHNNIWNTTTKNDNAPLQYPNTFLDYQTGPLAPPNFTTRKDFHSDPDWNLLATRIELDLGMTFTPNLTGSVKARGYYMADVNDGYRFKPNPPGWINEFEGRPNNFQVDYYGNAGGPFEIAQKDWMADLASAYVDYITGPLWLRIGHQQIAWGEALFFRVADLANGLDVRRHLVLDFGLEEYADERQASPGIRLNYTFNQTWAIDMFAQMFRPTTLPGPNTPYSVIPAALTVQWGEGFDKVDDQINGGFRLMGTFGDVGLNFFAVSRHNPDPILRTVAAGQTNAGLPGFETIPFRSVNVAGVARQPGEGLIVTQSEWFKLTSRAGIDGVDVLNGLGEDYSVVQTLVTPVVQTRYGVRDGVDGLVLGIEDTTYVLGAFQAILGELDAVVQPVFAAENVFGGSVNFINYAEPDTLLDQLVTRVEVSYTPDKKFTKNGRNKFYDHDELVAALIMEKYHKFTDKFAATYFVFQWMHKTESDLFGRPLKWMGGETDRRPTGGERKHGWDAVVLAAVQPFPNAIWQADIAFLYDLDGGYLVQPGVKYKASEAMNFDLYANIINSWDTATSLQPIEWADELVARITYQF